MFQWLRDEMALIKTNKFHLVEGPASLELREAVKNSDSALPDSYKKFVLEFGNTKLYRRSSRYYITVFAGPRLCEPKDGETLIQFGSTDTSLAYFKESLLTPEKEAPVFEWYHGAGTRKTADGFEEWLTKKCKAARRKYKKQQWDEVIAGPKPFTPEERKIVEARRKFRWRVAGVSSAGDIQFEVHNGSDVVLPFLSIGIRGKHRNSDGALKGGVWLPVKSVLPGQTVVIEKDCYKKWVDPKDIEAFEEPDPGPEDRDQYWEFKLK